MLSKLTFSLAFVLMLALLAGPALAQQVTISQDLVTAAVDSKKFIVHTQSTTTGPSGANPNGVIASVGAVPETTAGTFPDVKDILEFGGTIELISMDADAELYITEVMWGLNLDPAQNAANQTASQWIRDLQPRA